jgi:hypothetical protein
MPVSVGRQVLKPLENDCGADYETQRHPKPTWVGQTEQETKERVGDNPLVQRIMGECRAESDWRQGDKNDKGQRDPGQDCKASLKHSLSTLVPATIGGLSGLGFPPRRRGAHSCDAEDPAQPRQGQDSFRLVSREIKRVRAAGKNPG